MHRWERLDVARESVACVEYEGCVAVDLVDVPELLDEQLPPVLTAERERRCGGKKFRLMGWSFSSSAAATLIFGDNAVGTVILRTELLAADRDPPRLQRLDPSGRAAAAWPRNGNFRMSARNAATPIADARSTIR